jgi:hypothetical protein
MKVLGSAIIALIALLLVDQEFNGGRYWRAATAIARHMAASIGLN